MNTVIAKIAAASTKVGALMPDKTNTSQNYSYISADKILERAGDALAEVGIIILPAITEEAVEEVTYTDGYGKTKTRYDARVHFEMLVSDGEGELKAPWAGRGSDFAVPDKAMYKAITSGHKYFIAKLLNIGVGNEDGEHEEETQQPRQAPQKAQAARKDADASGVPTDAELAILGTWQSPQDAQKWAMEKGTCKNEFEAKQSFKNVVDEHGGRLTKENVALVYLLFLRKHIGKLQQKAA